jgi:hypothetical protein
VALVDDDVAVLEAPQPVLVLHHELVRREQHVEARHRAAALELRLEDRLAHLRRALIRDDERSERT